MATPSRPPAPTQSVDLTAAPRVVVATAADLLFRVGRSVLGPDRVPTAQANARAAVAADQQRARERAEIERWLVRNVRDHQPVG
jgi:hypothetical protein